MKKITTLLATATAALGLLAACGGNDTGSSSSASATEAEISKVIRAGSTGQSFPNGYKEGDKLVGFDVELLEEAAKRAGYTVEWTTVDFSGLMGQLEAGRLDTVANNVAVTPERADAYDFTDIYAYMGTSIAVAEDSSLTDLTDLEGKTVAGVAGSNNLKTLDAWAADNGVSVTVRPYETRDGAQLDLLGQRVDGYVQSLGIILAEIAKDGLPIRVLGQIGIDEIALPFAKDETGTALREAINEQIEAMRADGSLEELSIKYFGEDITVAPDLP